MSGMTDYLENQIADHIFRGATFTKPSALYVALFTAAPSDAGGGTEVTGGSYARVQRDPSNTNWNGTHGNTTGASSGTGGNVDNAAAITFPAPTQNWGQATHWAIMDAASGGNMLFHGVLTVPKTINNGDPAPAFNAGELDITFG